jgi:hypothetical protein
MSAGEDQTYPVVQAADWEQKTWGLQIQPVSKGEDFATESCPPDAHPKMAWYFTPPKQTEMWKTGQQLPGSKTKGGRGETEWVFSPQSAWYNVMPDEPGDEFKDQEVLHGFLIGTKVCVKLAKEGPDSNIPVWAPVDSGWSLDGNVPIQQGGIISSNVVVYRAERVDGVPHDQLPHFEDTFTPLEDMGIDSVGSAHDHFDWDNDDPAQLTSAEYIDNPEAEPDQDDGGGGTDFDQSATSFEDDPGQGDDADGPDQSVTSFEDDTDQTPDPDVDEGPTEEEPGAGEEGSVEMEDIPTEEEEILEVLEQEEEFQDATDESTDESTQSQPTGATDEDVSEAVPSTGSGDGETEHAGAGAPQREAGDMVDADISLSGEVSQSSLKSLVSTGEFETVEIDSTGIDTNEFADEVESAIDSAVSGGGGDVDAASAYDTSSWNAFWSDCSEDFDVERCGELWSQVKEQ